jgi:hypothetical protein
MGRLEAYTQSRALSEKFPKAEVIIHLIQRAPNIRAEKDFMPWTRAF